MLTDMFVNVLTVASLSTCSASVVADLFRQYQHCPIHHKNQTL